MGTNSNVQKISTQPLILLPTMINGKGPFDFVLDTGAGMTILTEELAGILGVVKIGVKEAIGSPGKKMNIPLGTVESMSIGETRVETMTIAIMENLPRCAGHGVLGHNFLKNFIVIIDYRKRTVQCDTPTNHSHCNNTGSTSLKLNLARPDRPIILVDACVNKRSAHRFILDTGASQTVVSTELAEEYGIAGEPNNLLIGAGGVNQSSIGVLKTLTVGDTRLDDVSVLVTDIFRSLSDSLGIRVDGILGYNWLNRFRIIIDYPHEILRFQE